MTSSCRVVALSGGVGGAKLALGLSRVVAGGDLVIVANPGDDFEHLGLAICPDLDTLTYVLAGIDDPVRGWGRAEETWNFMESLRAGGGATWFNLGDKDLELHKERTRRLAAGESLSAITTDITRRSGIAARILPATDDTLRTVVETEDGPLPFQHYFVRERCAPRVRGFRYDGAAAARPNPAVLEALLSPELEAVVICPSNPYISIDPMLAMPALRRAIAATRAPVVAVSPIVGGKAIKGPAAKMMAELGVGPTAAAIAAHYGALLDGFALDAPDASIAPPCLVADTVMTDTESKIALARAVLDFARSLPRARSFQAEGA
jgi:LPPG:FO 2-phospho-L-lactate transferase